MFWVETDSYSPEALGYIRRQSPHPISSCETLLGLREFVPYFHEQAMDIAINVDLEGFGGGRDLHLPRTISAAISRR